MKEQFTTYLNTLVVAFNGKELWIFGSICLGAFLLFMFLSHAEVLFRSKFLLLVAITVFVGTNLAEILEIQVLEKSDMVWWLDSFSGFCKAIVALIASIVIAPIQYNFLSLATHAINHHGGYSASNMLGCLGYLVGVVAGIILYLITSSNIPATVIFVGFHLAQLVTMVKACHNSGGNYFMILPSFLFYFLGTGALVYVIARLSAAFFFLVVLGIMLNASGHGSAAESGAASSLIGEDSIKDGFAGGTVYGTRIDRDNFFGGGNHYVRVYDGLSDVWVQKW